MKFIRYISVAVIVGIGLLFLLFSVFMIRISPGEVGVRTVQYSIPGSKKGVEERDFDPGWHRNLPLIDTWHIFDSTVQTTEFTTVEERQQAMRRMSNYKLFNLGQSSISNYPSTGPEQIELKSKDGYTVRLDVTVKYRISPGNVHRLYRKFNTESRYKSIVRDQVQNTMRNVLGTMKTEEFYDPTIRREKTDIAFTELSNDLGDNAIELINILIRDITFDASYERKILDKKLADQDVELNKSRALAEEQKGQTNKIIAETEAKVRVIQEQQQAERMTMKAETDRQIAQISSEAKVKVAELMADADLYAAETIAQGTLLEKEAQAEGEQLKAAALTGTGGANLVARETVRNLNLNDMNVSTIATDFLDVDGMVKKLGAEE